MPGLLGCIESLYTWATMLLHIFQFAVCILDMLSPLLHFRLTGKVTTQKTVVGGDLWCLGTPFGGLPSDTFRRGGGLHPNEFF